MFLNTTLIEYVDNFNIVYFYNIPWEMIDENLIFIFSQSNL